jgi:hypothetical protein
MDAAPITQTTVSYLISCHPLSAIATVNSKQRRHSHGQNPEYTPAAFGSKGSLERLQYERLAVDWRDVIITGEYAAVNHQPVRVTLAVQIASLHI